MGIETKNRNLAPHRIVLIKATLLIACCAWAFWPELRQTYLASMRDPNWAHALAMPVAILILLIRRRAWLADRLSGESVWGLVLLLIGFVVCGLSIWPFNYGYFRFFAMVPVLAGAMLAVGGWGVLRVCLPILLLFWLAIPIGNNAYASMVIRLETVTLSGARLVLDLLPGVDATLKGADLLFVRGGTTGPIALGEPFRGASLLVPCLTIGVFVSFAQIRPIWQILISAIMAGPIVLVCNLLRIVSWGVVTIYGGFGPLSPVPRTLSAICALLAAYLSFVLLLVMLSSLVVEEDDEGDLATGMVE
jgi:hypothetical protein